MTNDGGGICVRCSWHKPVPHGCWEWNFKRGFVGEVTCSGEEWERLGPDVVRSQPIERVNFSNINPEREDRDPGFSSWRVDSWRSWPWDDLLERRWYETAGDVAKALSEVAIKWAWREVAKRVTPPAGISVGENAT
jgi:hypothetical protein